MEVDRCLLAFATTILADCEVSLKANRQGSTRQCGSLHPDNKRAETAHITTSSPGSLRAEREDAVQESVIEVEPDRFEGAIWAPLIDQEVEIQVDGIGQGRRWYRAARVEAFPIPLVGGGVH